MAFTFERTDIDGVYIITPQCFGDDRGYFLETYQKDIFDKAGLDYTFVQSNQSKSHKGVLRGLHFQTRKPQAKLVRVVEGEVYDVAVDLRKDSPTYGKYVGVTLSAEKHNMFMIPRGFAHGFVVLSDKAVFEYMCDDVYDPGYEGGLPFDDESINIKWPEVDGELDLSLKDKKHPSLKDSKIVFGMKEGHLQVL